MYGREGVAAALIQNISGRALDRWPVISHRRGGLHGLGPPRRARLRPIPLVGQSERGIARFAPRWRHDAHPPQRPDRTVIVALRQRALPVRAKTRDTAPSAAAVTERGLVATLTFERRDSTRSWPSCGREAFWQVLRR